MEPTAVMPAANHETQPMAQNGIAPSVPPSLSRAEMIEQLCAYDDAEFADTLLTLTEKNHYGHGFTMLHDPTVLARVLACTDEWFIYAVTAMAHETHIGVDLLFAEVIKRRVNALPPDTFRGKFSMSLRRVLPGFDMHAYQRSLWEQQQLDLRQQAPPTQMHQVTPPPPALLPRGVDIEQDRARLPQVVRQAEEVLLTLPGAPVIFQRARRLVSVAPAEPTARSIARDEGTPIINPMTLPRLRALLADAANWWTPDGRSKTLKPDMPQYWVVETLLDQDAWQFPPLTGLVNAPTMRPDGSLILTQGYDTATGLWVHWHGVQFPAIPPNPTLADAQTALSMLSEPFLDFPFGAPHHLAAALAAVLTLIARYAVKSVPLFAIRATTRGSGKTLLADAIAMIATGRHAPKMPQVTDEDEERKRLLALALDGDPLVVIDNVVGALGNPALDLAITTQLYKDRLLGKNSTKEAPLHTVFLATGNNMFFRGDMARRALPIDIAPLMERPETRQGFVHPRLLDFIQQDRPRLVSAALTLLRAYWEAGLPPQPLEPYGSFEEWSDLIRSALVWAGAADPNMGREGLEAASDETFEAHAELLAAWHVCYGSVPMPLTAIIGDFQTRTTPPNTHPAQRTDSMEHWDRLRDALGAFDERYDGQRLNTKSLAKALKKLTGRVIDQKRLRQKEQRTKYGTMWVVEALPIVVATSHAASAPTGPTSAEATAPPPPIPQDADACPQCHAASAWMQVPEGRKCPLCGCIEET